MLEAGASDPRLSSLEKISAALGHGKGDLARMIAGYWQREENSIEIVSSQICRDGESSWKIRLFDFVDAFRRKPGPNLVASPPIEATPERIRCLLASTVETLCEEFGIQTPWWTRAVGRVTIPWFVAGVENLKAMALVESPIHFRKRNIFVLDNFLNRA